MRKRPSKDAFNVHNVLVVLGRGVVPLREMFHENVNFISDCTNFCADSITIHGLLKISKVKSIIKTTRNSLMTGLL